MKFIDVEKKIAEGKSISEDEKEFILKKIDDYWDNHPDVLDRFPRWKKYIAWTAGYQSYDYNRVTRALVDVPLDKQRRLVINKIKPYVRTLLSKLTADMPQMSVIPNTTEDEDIQGARVGDKIIEGLSEKLDFDATVTNLKLWTILCNRSFVHVFWNEDDEGVVGYGNAPQEDNGKEPLDVTLNPEALSQPDAPMVPITESGEVCIEAISPFNCRVDTLYWEHSKWRWFLYGDEVDAERLEEKYELKAGSLKEHDDTFEKAYDIELSDEQDVAMGSPDKKEDPTDRAIVRKEFWTPKIYIFTAGKKILEYGKNEFKTIPFFPVEDRLVPISSYDKEFSYNESLIRDVIPIQREYNRQASIKSIALDRASKLKVMSPIGSLLSKKQWTNDYGVFIDYNPHAGEPHQLKLEPFPMEMMQYEQSLEAQMQSSMSLSPASFGLLPERASHASGTLVNLLLEQDEVILNPLLNCINKAISKVWTLALQIVQSNYTASRLTKITGDDGAASVEKFKGTDIRGNTDVRVVSQTGLPRNRALRIEYVMKLREAGLLTDDKSTLEMLEFGNANKIFEDNFINERKAWRENSLVEDTPGITPDALGAMFYKLEDHNAHLKIHLKDRLSIKWEKYDEGQKASLDGHIEMHNMALMPPPMPVPPGAPAKPDMPPPPPGGPAPMPGPPPPGI